MRAPTLAGQKRTCLTHMYNENFSTQLPRFKIDGTPRVGRDALRGEDQNYDPDWQFKFGSQATRGINDLVGKDYHERITTYKLERMDYTVREVPYGMAPPPAPREVSNRVTLDML